MMKNETVNTCAAILRYLRSRINEIHSKAEAISANTMICFFLFSMESTDRKKIIVKKPRKLTKKEKNLISKLKKQVTSINKKISYLEKSGNYDIARLHRLQVKVKIVRNQIRKIEK